MHREIAVWLTGHPWRAAIASAVCGALSQVTAPFVVLAGAIPVLVALRFDLRYAFAMAVTATTAASWVALSAEPPLGGWFFFGIGLLFFGPMLLAWLLRRAASLNLIFQVAVLGMAALLTVLHLSLPDATGMWLGLLNDMYVSLTKAGLVIEGDQAVIVAAWARLMWGTLAALVLATGFSSLLLGRWWQSLLDAPGTFGVEYRQLRLGRTLGIATTVLFIAALAVDSALIASLAWVAFAALAFQGLAAAHRSKAVGRLNRGWLVAIYVLLVALPVTWVVVFMLAIWGFADNWLRPRTLLN